MRRLTRFAPLLLIAFASACRTEPPTPDLGELYGRAARAHHPERNPVIVIPGILGSNLRDGESGRVVWGAFTGDFADPQEPDGARLIALPMREGEPLSALRDQVVEDGALATLEVDLFGLPLVVSAYFNILRALGVGGYRDEELGEAGAIDYGADHYTCFQFSYDWRRDISEIADELHHYILEKEAYIRAESERRGIGRDEIRFDVVAHSMGGLVLRYYLRYGHQALPDDGSLPALDWSGAERIERAFLVGTPNAGSIQAFRELEQGLNVGPFLPHYGPAILGTMPAVYQLLARPRHGAWVATEGDLGDPLDPGTWVRHGWGLAGPDVADELEVLLPEATPGERRRIALDHLTKSLARARQFFAAMDVASTPPSGTELYLGAGDAIGTAARVRIDPETGDENSVEYAPGDGVVLRSSALMDERLTGEWQPVLVSPIEWERVMFFFRGHLELTQDPAFIDNLLYSLLEEPR